VAVPQRAGATILWGRRIHGRIHVSIDRRSRLRAPVLGACGCGDFGNDSQEVAEGFQQALASHFHGLCGKVIFAVLDWSEERRFIGPFERLFQS
jgi:uncharacterized protein (TIGR02452 family)